MFKGEDIVAVADDHVGERYVLGSIAPLANPNWKGPWDCAEFASWCAYQAYGVIFAVHPPDPRNGESYSGWWYDDAIAQKRDLAVAEALGTLGVVLVRRPRTTGGRKRIGHVAISLGDNRTIEAKDAANGVAIVDGADQRQWHIGVKLPGVSYARARSHAYSEPSGLLHLEDPLMRSPSVATLQRALMTKGIDVAGIDGHFGRLTEAAVINFQIQEGLVADGVVGPETAAALGLEWPIRPSDEDVAAYERAGSMRFRIGEARAAAIDELEVEARPPHADPALAIAEPIEFKIEVSGKSYFAVPSYGDRFFIGEKVSYKDDMARVGLHQKTSDIERIDDAGVYSPQDWDSTKDVESWAWFLWPTITAESSGRFGRLNSYDRAAFTFGCYQFAAHTPNDNLVLLFRRLLELDDAETYFPDLSLRPNALGVKTVHYALPNAKFKDLEVARDVTRPNGKVERQIPAFMAYLNPDPKKVDNAEALAAARLLSWCINRREAREAQVRLALAIAQRKLVEATKKLPKLRRTDDWRVFLWISDIRHQGRGTYSAMREALDHSDPVAALSQIGRAHYAGRIKTVRDMIKRIEAGGKLKNWTPEIAPEV
jgi:peptidoglycan hydrolase-like protein with peptidoglycan-binding domain